VLHQGKGGLVERTVSRDASAVSAKQVLHQGKGGLVERTVSRDASAVSARRLVFRLQ
jgi:hypothetical protein